MSSPTRHRQAGLLALFIVTASVISVINLRRPAAAPNQNSAEAEPVAQASSFLEQTRLTAPRKFELEQLTLWWDAVPESVQQSLNHSSTRSNIHPGDYTGIETCAKCHPKEHSGWLTHAHRRMNALASPQSVVGDFSGQSSIHYQGGTATFTTSSLGDYSMLLQKGQLRREYRITQTIGSRFFQYYVGVQTVGPEPVGHKFYSDEHVLPFGYWIEEQEWVPVVHVGDEVEDDLRPDPFDHPPESSQHYARYGGCNMCHTTFPFADMYVRNGPHLGHHLDHEMHWDLGTYVSQQRPELLSPHSAPWQLSDDELKTLAVDYWQFEAPEHAVDLGITCEACHLGCAEHVSNPTVKPRFAAFSPHLYTSEPYRSSRTPKNLNRICARCHIGYRPTLAAGMSTWNSTEFTDAMQGSCYSELTCVHCHNPHQGIGRKWSLSAEQDDQSCLSCHQQYREPSRLEQHTHHAVESLGSRCMNCHMPHLNEGLQDVVRTHTIFSPTNAEMIAANHPNACNLCHLDQSVAWTIDHLRDWYGAEFDSNHLATVLDNPDDAAKQWFYSDNESVRLIVSSAVVRTKAMWALPELIRLLNDPFLVNRQFTQRGIEQMLGVNLEEYGYHFYLSKKERSEPLTRIRQALLVSPPHTEPQR